MNVEVEEGLVSCVSDAELLAVAHLSGEEFEKHMHEVDHGVLRVKTDVAY